MPTTLAPDRVLALLAAAVLAGLPLLIIALGPG
jgi:hypothetical protein